MKAATKILLAEGLANSSEVIGYEELSDLCLELKGRLDVQRQLKALSLGGPKRNLRDDFESAGTDEKGLTGKSEESLKKEEE